MIGSEIAPGVSAKVANRAAGVQVTPMDGHGTWLVALTGEHDLSTAQRLAEQTSPIWQFCKYVIIDLSDADFIDSGVIRWLLQVERELEAAGAFTLSVVAGQPGSPAARLFGLLHMRHVLACYATREDAFNQAPPCAASGPCVQSSGRSWAF